jgi:tRNA(Ile)-lysidine synthase
MASTRKPPPADPAAGIAGRFAHRLDRLVAGGSRVCVGLSGGLDSVVLLDLLDHLAAERGLVLSAIHVHHGLSAHADDWVAHCRALCTSLGVPLRVERVQVPRDSGEGIEAAARAARYAAFASVEADVVALAHHEDDQAETLLLQLMRGAGVAGLAAMPPARTHGTAGAPTIVRPLLGIPRSALHAHALARGLRWIEDDSNDDQRLRRNRIRHAVMPVLATVEPAVAANLARAARHLGEAADLLREWGAIDAAAARAAAGWDIRALMSLGPARGRNALRSILVEAGLRAPATRMLEEAWRQLTAARADAAVLVRVQDRVLRRYRDVLHLVAATDGPGVVPGEAADLAWSGGAVRLTAAIGDGLDAGKVADGALALRARAGGERFRPVGSLHHRTLKNLFQEHAVPPWERSRLPLLYLDGRLAWVPGVGVAAELAAGPGVPGRLPVWVDAAR